MKTVKMNGHELRKLIKKFNLEYENCSYAGHMASKTKGEEKEEWESEEEFGEYELFDIADKIKKAEISRYCKKKYELELEDILNNF